MIQHVMKDGKELASIEGHEVAREDAPEVYDMMERLNREASK